MSVPVESESGQFVTAGEIRGLLKHLQRAGVTFLPTPEVIAEPAAVMAGVPPLRPAAALSSSRNTGGGSGIVAGFLPLPMMRSTRWSRS